VGRGLHRVYGSGKQGSKVTGKLKKKSEEVCGGDILKPKKRGGGREERK